MAKVFFTNILKIKDTIKKCEARIFDLYRQIGEEEEERRRWEKQLALAMAREFDYMDKFPVEILVEIFQIYLNPNRRYIRTLLLVCKKWYELVINTPSLWNRIDLSFPEPSFDRPFGLIPYVQACKQRSRSLKLEIDLDLRNINGATRYHYNILENTLDEKFDRYFMEQTCETCLLDAVAETFHNSSHQYECRTYERRVEEVIDTVRVLVDDGPRDMARWSSFHLALPHSEEGTMEIAPACFLLEGLTNSLRNISIEGLDNWFDISSDNEKFHHLPCLGDCSLVERLTLRRSEVDLTLTQSSIQYSSIKHLDISVDHRNDLSQMWHLGSLETLVIVVMPTQPNSSVEISRQGNIRHTLSRLHSLEIRGQLDNDWFQILNFDTPSLRNFSMVLWEWSQESNTPLCMKFPQVSPRIFTFKFDYAHTISSGKFVHWNNEEYETSIHQVLHHFPSAERVTFSGFTRDILCKTLLDRINRGQQCPTVYLDNRGDLLRIHHTEMIE
jgi:hypothetical protein